MIIVLVLIAFLLLIWVILTLSVEINKNLLKNQKMIKGYIIKKIGEDSYLQYFPGINGEGTWDFGGLPFIFKTEVEAQGLSKMWDVHFPTEVKRADIFITP